MIYRFGSVRAVLLASAIVLLSMGAPHAQQPVRIGVLADQSGMLADFGGPGSVLAARMAAQDAGGTVLGRPIEILVGDHQNKADIASQIARQWYDSGVDAIADLTNSAVALAVQQVAIEKGKITLISGAATTRLTNDLCSPTGFHWTFDTYSQANGTARAAVAEGNKTWFLLTADYAFGHQMANDLTRIVTASGGTVVGQVKPPFNTPDFSSFLLTAQASHAQIIGLVNAGDDTVNAVKQAASFGIQEGGQHLAALVVVITDVKAMGLEVAQGLLLTTAFDWELNDATRAWSERFMGQSGRMPGMVQAGTYSAVSHYLKAIKASGTTDPAVVAAKMHELPVDDMFAHGRVREDGRLLHDMYLAQVKSPAESKGPWDFFKILRTIPAEDAAQPLSMSTCRLVKK